MNTFENLPPEIQQWLWDNEHNPSGHVKRALTADLGDEALVIVGNVPVLLHHKMHFHEFLVSFSKKIMGEDWGTKELQKPFDDRHPLIQWYSSMAEQSKSKPPPKSKLFGRIASAPYAAYLTFSYDLYILLHHNVLPETLLKRLKNKKQFQGARYELYVAAAFIRAGFTIDFDKEYKPSSSHCEFTAGHRDYDSAFSVEAKSRHRKGFLGNPGQPEPLSQIKPDVGRLLRRALRKKAAHSRIIFTDLNLPVDECDVETPSWVFDLGKEINLERKRPGEEWPSAFLFFTNRPFHFVDSESEAPDSFSILTAINVPLFDDVSFRAQDIEAVRKKYPEIVLLFESLKNYGSVPITFQ